MYLAQTVTSKNDILDFVTNREKPQASLQILFRNYRAPSEDKRFLILNVQKFNMIKQINENAVQFLRKTTFVGSLDMKETFVSLAPILNEKGFYSVILSLLIFTCHARPGLHKRFCQKN